MGPESERDDLDARLAELLADGVRTGWEGLCREQRAVLDDFWAHADVEVEGDDDLQQAVRFALFHVFQAAAQGTDRGIPAKGLTGTGYDGHTFWDTEVFVLPVLNHVWPQAAAEALRWRHRMLPAARDRARELGLAGASFPWRTITGRESSGYWPAGTAAVHLGADIADAAVRHLQATGDEDLAREALVDLVVETARTWVVLGREDAEGRFHVDGVTGPDEYSALVDDNAYTNLMAQANLRAAVELTKQFPAQAEALGVDDAELAEFARLADAVHLPREPVTGVPAQDEGATQRKRWDFEGTRPDQYPLADSFPYFSLYRRQVVKQADLVLALYLRPEAFTWEDKRDAFEHAEGVTVRDSSLSAAVQAVVAAEVGHLDLAAEYAHEAAFVDLHDLRGKTADGLHIASLGGAWLALVAGYGGMRDAVASWPSPRGCRTGCGGCASARGTAARAWRCRCATRRRPTASWTAVPSTRATTAVGSRWPGRAGPPCPSRPWTRRSRPARARRSRRTAARGGAAEAPHQPCRLRARSATSSNRVRSRAAPSRRTSRGATRSTRSRRTSLGRRCRSHAPVPTSSQTLPSPRWPPSAPWDVVLARHHEADELVPVPADDEDGPVLAAAVVLLEGHPRPHDLAGVGPAVGPRGVLEPDGAGSGVAGPPSAAGPGTVGGVLRCRRDRARGRGLPFQLADEHPQTRPQQSGDVHAVPPRPRVMRRSRASRSRTAASNPRSVGT